MTDHRIQVLIYEAVADLQTDLRIAARSEPLTDEALAEIQKAHDALGRVVYDALLGLDGGQWTKTEEGPRP